MSNKENHDSKYDFNRHFLEIFEILILALFLISVISFLHEQIYVPSEICFLIKLDLFDIFFNWIS